MAVNKVIFGNETLIDTSEVTVTPETLVKGATALNAAGEMIEGEFTETDPTVPQWAKESDTEEYEVSGNPVTLNNYAHMPMNVVTVFEGAQEGSGYTALELITAGKNLCPNNGKTATSNGVTFTVNADGSITINGTATAQANIRIAGSYNGTDAVFSYKAGTKYILSTSATNYGSFAMYSRQSGEWKSVVQINSLTGSFVPTEDGYVTDIFFFVPSGTTVDNVTVYPQIEINSAATSYEPYQGKTYTVQLGQTVYSGSFDWNTGKLTIGSENPTEIQLKPHDITAVHGVNTLYGDGMITVSGRKDVYYVIDSLEKRVDKAVEDANSDLFQGGFVSYGTINANSKNTITVTFDKPYAEPPFVVVGLYGNSTSAKYGMISAYLQHGSVTTTGFVSEGYNADTSARSPWFTWIAIGKKA